MNTSSRSSLHNHQPVTDELGRDVPQLKSYSKSLKGSLGSLYNLNQRQLLGSNSALAEWNYVMSQSNNGSSAAPSVVDRASVSGYSYATKKTARGELLRGFEVCYMRAHLGAPGGAYREPTFQGVFRPKFIKREASEVYCVKFSPDDEFIAAGLGNSFIQVVPEPNVQINCVTYQNNLNSETAGAYFASSGSDSYVRVYDSQNHKKLLEMNRGQGDISAGHSSRVFSVRFHPTEQNILISGGWDNTIQFWDTRIGHSVRSIYGPHICGSDSLDFNQDGSEILTASFAKEDQLQMWDFGSGKLIDTIAWSIMEGERKNSLLYSGSFGKSKAPGGGVQYAIAGGCGGFNEVKLFNLQTKRAVGVAQGFTHSVYSVVMSSNEKMIAVGGGFKAVYAYDVDMHQQTSELIY
ncbi:hypothetical protein HDU79_004988 [Rhizoclosmatium sp. JEL0117]|nr:hypothetical protein HDU79_004988 [Rhizoclosmatium sp. JEL0117]